MVVFDK